MPEDFGQWWSSNVITVMMIVCDKGLFLAVSIERNFAGNLKVWVTVCTYVTNSHIWVHVFKHFDYEAVRWINKSANRNHCSKMPCSEFTSKFRVSFFQVGSVLKLIEYAVTNSSDDWTGSNFINLWYYFRRLKTGVWIMFRAFSLVQLLSCLASIIFSGAFFTTSDMAWRENEQLLCPKINKMTFDKPLVFLCLIHVILIYPAFWFP